MSETTLDQLQIIIGLGNPGEKYKGTRHNIGADILDLLSQELKITFKDSKKLISSIAKDINNNLILVKPLSYMNLSGNSAIQIKKFYKVKVQNILVIYDDFDLTLGSIRIREKGSAGSHNGMKSIIQTLGTDMIPRMRLGIGSQLDPTKIQNNDTEIKNKIIKSNVLGKFNQTELNKLTNFKKNILNALIFYKKNGIIATMNKFNKTE